MATQNKLTDNELRALAYFAVGVSSEGNKAGRDISNKLVLCGTVNRDGTWHPVEKSGISVGTLQVDLGQDHGETAKKLIDAYQAWTRKNYPNQVLSDDQKARTIRDLSRNGHQINDDHGRPLDAEIKSRLDGFLASEAGKDVVYAHDKKQVDDIMKKVLTPLSSSSLFARATADEQARMAVIVAKAYNQNPSIGKELRSHMLDDSGLAADQIFSSFDDVMHYSDGFRKTMKDGRNMALDGADIFMHLRNASPQNPLHDAWQEVLNDPLIKPSQVGQDATRPHFAAEYTTIKNLFLEPARSKDFINALEQGSDYNYGLPQAVGNSRATSGFFVSGADFVQWNVEGKGVARIGGEWSEIAREDITRVKQPDNAVDLSINRNGTPEPLLHVEPASPVLGQSRGARTLRQGMHGDDVHALQSQLAQMGYTDARGRPLHSDGDFGATTHAAVQAFQRDQGLTADGVAGPATLAAVGQALQVNAPSIAQPDAAYLHHGEASDAMSAYRTFAPEPIPGLTPATQSAHSPPISESPTAPSWAAPGAPVPPVTPTGSVHALNDPRNPDNPDHALYNELHQRIPEASENRLLQFTAACHENKITADNLSTIHLNEEGMTICFSGSSFLSTLGVVDLNTPPLQPQQSIQHIQQYDQQQAQMMSEIRAYNAQVEAQAQQGPMLGGQQGPMR